MSSASLCLSFTRMQYAPYNACLLAQNFNMPPISAYATHTKRLNSFVLPISPTQAAQTVRLDAWTRWMRSRHPYVACSVASIAATVYSNPCMTGPRISVSQSDKEEIEFLSTLLHLSNGGVAQQHLSVTLSADVIPFIAVLTRYFNPRSLGSLRSNQYPRFDRLWNTH